MRRVIPAIVVFAAFVGVWYLGSTVLVQEGLRFLLPTPDAVVRIAFLDQANLQELLAGLALSARVALTGLALATAIGLGWAIVMSQARWLEDSLYPYAVLLQTVPILALVPLLGYWFGFGFSSRVLTCVLIALFPIVANTLFGLRSVDPALRDLFALHGAGRLTRLLKLQLPAALPAILTGLRISAGAAVIGAVVGDFFFQQGQPGIGQLIYVYPRRLQSEMLFAAVILASLLGLVVFWLFGLVARWGTAWHESQHQPQPPGGTK
jgi:NitT/TauT family transport system permease protein